MTMVVTGWHPKGYDLYGRNFAESFAKHWPRSVDLACYTETPVPLPRGECRSLWDCNGVREFVDRHKDNPAHCGRSLVPRWKEKEVAAGYSFRFDAVKFCKQLFIPEHAADSLPDDEVLAWFDADVVTFKNVPDGFVEQLLGDSDLAYLGRDGKHSEIGFWAVRLNSRTRIFLESLADMYREYEVFDLPEWHSAYVFDHVRERHERAGLTARNLTPGGRGHVWFQCQLGWYTDHLKGNRKNAGRSRERR